MWQVLLSCLCLAIICFDGDSFKVHANEINPPVVTSDDAKYDFARVLSEGKLRILWRVVTKNDTINENLSAPILRFKVEAVGSDVWIGIGISKFVNHDNSSAQAAAVMTGPGNTCAEYLLLSTSQTMQIQSESDFSCKVYVETRQNDGSTGLSLEVTTRNLGGFSLPLAADNDNSSQVIFAMGEGVSPTAHTVSGSLVVDWTYGGLDYIYSVLRLTHAILMVFAFVFLFPLGILMPAIFKPALNTRIKSVRIRDQWAKKFKHYKNDPHEFPSKSFLARRLGRFRWLRAHEGLNSTGLALCLVGFACIIPTVSNHFRSIHHILGLVVILIICIQPIMAKYRPHDTDFIKSNSRLQWEIAHKNLGRVAFAVAYTNMFIGSGLYAPFLAPIMGSEVFVYSFFFLLTLPACIFWSATYVLVILARKGKVKLPFINARDRIMSEVEGRSEASEIEDANDQPVSDAKVAITSLKS
jgi:hypothetical protein